MSTSYNNSKILMDTNLKMPQKKDFNLIKMNKKKRKWNNKKLHLKDSANYANKFCQKKLKKFKSVKDSTNPHVPWSPVNTDGQQTWKES